MNMALTQAERTMANQTFSWKESMFITMKLPVSLTKTILSDKKAMNSLLR